MMIDTGLFRDGMSRLGASVNVITTDGAAGRHGLTVSAVCSVTDTPPSLLVCVNASSRSHPYLTQNSVLCVNILAGRHEHLSRLFAAKNVGMDERFAAARWKTLATGAPVLADAAAAFDCRVAETMEVGTHSIFICEVVAMTVQEEAENLVYFNRGFHHLPADRAATA